LAWWFVFGWCISFYSGLCIIFGGAFMSVDDVIGDFPGLSGSYVGIARRLYTDSYVQYYDRNDKVRRDSFRNGQVLLNYERALDERAKDYSEAVVRAYLGKVTKSLNNK
jgi:hypothetical protein